MIRPAAPPSPGESLVPSTLVAVDWSGAGTNERARLPGIWLAAWRAGSGTVTLAGRLSREEVISWLLVEAQLDPRLVVGFDFSFSFPWWFARRQGRTIDEVWRKVEAEGEAWLAAAAYPFWRTRQPEYPPDQPAWRATELAIPGRKPSSTFKLVGDGQVGAGSLRGMPSLRRLRRGGFAVWPFLPAALPLAIEIYPTACYPPRARATRASRSQHLAGESFAAVPTALREQAAASGDAFDALAALLAMVAHRHCFAALPVEGDPRRGLEGAIWRPAACVCSEAPVH